MLERFSLFSVEQLLRAAFLLLTVLFGLVLASYVMYLTSPEEIFYQENPKTHEQSQIQALSRPTLSSSALISWVSSGVTAAYSLNFVEYEAQVNDLRDYFTQSGYNSFINELNASGRLDQIVDQKLMVSAVVKQPPAIIREGSLLGVYTWEIHMILQLTYQGASLESTAEEQDLIVFVHQVSTVDAPKGIGIAQIKPGTQ